ncbi:hypothetical protein [Mucilaginibacter pocheonensis]|uniref:Uncharacterized protein n=1 Tax=Mucilaginibacter pocheonensis TaxID=398050 RepID=A0ABU1T9M0_9SPHI|nr:hypothetical protein [Mucilaginibacter pocheonensis]MDR6941936.1 hypothetical protein [Mucilaginibacter pocheonensis]
MIISLSTYRLIKNLCSYFNCTSNTCEVVNDETIVINSGSLRGLLLEFHYNICQVKVCGRLNLCIDITRDVSVDVLMRILMNHNIIPCPPAS